jgi:hypothetical protein
MTDLAAVKPPENSSFMRSSTPGETPTPAPLLFHTTTATKGSEQHCRRPTKKRNTLVLQRTRSTGTLLPAAMASQELPHQTRRAPPPISPSPPQPAGRKKMAQHLCSTGMDRTAGLYWKEVQRSCPPPQPTPTMGAPQRGRGDAAPQDLAWRSEDPSRQKHHLTARGRLLLLLALSSAARRRHRRREGRQIGLALWELSGRLWRSHKQTSPTWPGRSSKLDVLSWAWVAGAEDHAPLGVAITCSK